MALEGHGDKIPGLFQGLLDQGSGLDGIGVLTEPVVVPKREIEATLRHAVEPVAAGDGFVLGHRDALAVFVNSDLSTTRAEHDEGEVELVAGIAGFQAERLDDQADRLVVFAQAELAPAQHREYLRRGPIGQPLGGLEDLAIPLGSRLTLTRKVQTVRLALEPPQQIRRVVSAGFFVIREG